jgi:hypothetical protein
MDELTREEAIREHRKMWNWIANETKKSGHCVNKTDYFCEYAEFDEKIPYDKCYCCEYAFNVFKQTDDLKKLFEGDIFNNKCKYCPIDWGSESSHDMCCDIGDPGKFPTGLYLLWDESITNKDADSAYKYAKQIAELPEAKIIEDKEGDNNVDVNHGESK